MSHYRSAYRPMKIFKSLSLATGDRLFLFLFVVLFLIGESCSLHGQFKFREPPNRQDPQSLEKPEGKILWNRFLGNRSIGNFSITGVLEYRPAGQASRMMDFQLDGEWINGREWTRLQLKMDNLILVDKEVLKQGELTTVRDLGDECEKPETVQGNFYTQQLHEDLPLTWNDILMPFLNWKQNVYVGPSRYLGRPSHRYEVVNPVDGAFPAKAIVTIDEDFAALLKVDLVDTNGKAVRRMRIGGFKQFGDVWMFSELTWENRRSRESIRLLVEAFSNPY